MTKKLHDILNTKRKEFENNLNSDLWFGLSYAHWICVPRVALQSMPEIWQNKFFKLLKELYDKLEFPEGYNDLSFSVTAKKGNKFIKHLIPHYRHNYLKLI